MEANKITSHPVSSSTVYPRQSLQGDFQLEWQKKQPQEEGFYWYRGQEVKDIVRVYTRSHSSALRATGAFFEQHLVGAMEGDWAGPIPHPAG